MAVVKKSPYCLCYQHFLFSLISIWSLGIISHFTRFIQNISRSWNFSYIEQWIPFTNDWEQYLMMLLLVSVNSADVEKKLEFWNNSIFSCIFLQLFTVCDLLLPVNALSFSSFPFICFSFTTGFQAFAGSGSSNSSDKWERWPRFWSCCQEKKMKPESVSPGPHFVCYNHRKRGGECRNFV